MAEADTTNYEKGKKRTIYFNLMDSSAVVVDIAINKYKCNIYIYVNLKYRSHNTRFNQYQYQHWYRYY